MTLDEAINHYDFVKPYGGTLPWVYCRKPKKDGSPSRNITSTLPDSFIDCKIVEHELNELWNGT